MTEKQPKKPLTEAQRLANFIRSRNTPEGLKNEKKRREKAKKAKEAKKTQAKLFGKKPAKTVEKPLKAGVKFVKYGWVHPRDLTTGKSNLTAFAESAGVYLIKNEHGSIVYVGMSHTQLEDTILRHFFRCDDDTQYRVSLANGKDDKESWRRYKVRVLLMNKAACQIIKSGPLSGLSKVQAMEMALVIKYQPYHNENKWNSAFDRIGNKILVKKGNLTDKHNKEQERAAKLSKELDDYFDSTPKPIPSDDDDVPF